MGAIHSASYRFAEASSKAPPYGDQRMYILYLDILFHATFLGMASARIIPDVPGCLRIALTETEFTSVFHWGNLFRLLRMSMPDSWHLSLELDGPEQPAIGSRPSHQPRWF